MIIVAVPKPAAEDGHILKHSNREGHPCRNEHFAINEGQRAEANNDEEEQKEGKVEDGARQNSAEAVRANCGECSDGNGGTEGGQRQDFAGRGEPLKRWAITPAALAAVIIVTAIQSILFLADPRRRRASGGFS